MSVGPYAKQSSVGSPYIVLERQEMALQWKLSLHVRFKSKKS